MGWRIVIAGGGFGGAAARELERVLPRQSARLVMANEQNFALYTPFLPEAAAGPWSRVVAQVDRVRQRLESWDRPQGPRGARLDRQPAVYARRSEVGSIGHPKLLA